MSLLSFFSVVDICICGVEVQFPQRLLVLGSHSHTGDKPKQNDFKGTFMLELHTGCNCFAGLCVTAQWPVLRYLRLMAAQFTRSHADKAEETIIGVTHFIYSLTLSFIISSSASPCPRIFPSLGHSASLSLYPVPPLRQPTNGLPH